MLPMLTFRNRRLTILLGVFLLGLYFVHPGGAADSDAPQEQRLVLVRAGVAQAPILLAEDAPPMIRRAADELAHYMEKISGARPEVHLGVPEEIPEHAIWVGFQPRVTALFPGIDFDFQHPEEVLIAANENHVVIAGRDRWDPDRLVVQGRNRRIDGKQQEYGTVNAVYTFLQNQLNVRWLWPGDSGEDIVAQSTIALAPFEYRHHPQIRGRATILRLSALGDTRGHSQQWARLQRLQLDSLPEIGGGHPASDWWDKYHEEHPEYFALQPDGTRSGFPSPKNAKRCKSNPAVWERWIQEAAQSLEQYPDRTVFSASANDSHSRGICVCEHCREWDPPYQPGRGTALPNPEGVFETEPGDPSQNSIQDASPQEEPASEPENFLYSWQGTTENYVPMSDRYVRFANALGQKLKERFPDRDDLHVTVSAYGPSTPPPAEAQMDDNLIVSYVGHFPLTTESAREKQKREFAAWGAKAPAMLYRPNLWYWGGGIWGWPEIALKKTSEDFRFLAENNTVAIFIDGAWEHWATQGPQYYLMAQLAWDPMQDGEAVMDDYYRRGFGRAAEEIKAYWTMMEQANEAFMASPDIRTGSRGRVTNIAVAATIYDSEFLQQADRLLRRAASKVAAEPEIYGTRVAFVRAGFDVMRLMMQTIPIMERVRAGEGTDREAVEQAMANWQQIQQTAESVSPPGFRFEMILARMRSGYMGGVDDYLGPPSDTYRRAAGLD